ncbi:MAG TPA: DUF5985 family protein [Noviherbaspirillum sp.]
MAAITYMLCALTAFACGWMLLRSYIRTRSRLLLWSGLCFAVLFLNNLLLIVDRLLFPEIDLGTYRLLAALAALLPLLYGLIWEED